MPRALTALLLHTPPAVVACEFFAHPRAAVDRMLPARLFPLPPPRLHCRAARRCAACAGRTGPPLATACSRALRLLGSSARPRLRLRVWASAEPFLRGSGFAVTDCRRPPFGAANSLPPLAPARNAHTTREGGLGGEREAKTRQEASPPRSAPGSTVVQYPAVRSLTCQVGFCPSLVVEPLIGYK